MRKRKWLWILMSAMLIANFTAGCVSSGESHDVKNVTSDGNESEDSTQEEKVSIAEQVLIDQQDIVVTATEYVDDSIFGDGIKVLVENKTARDVTVSCNALIVNDYMISDFFVVNVAAGKQANDTIYLSSSQLEAAGIENVGKVEVYFHVYDSTTYDSIFDTDAVLIETSAFANMDTTVDDAGTELYNTGGVRIVGKTVDEDSFWGTAILLYCENTSGKNIGISVDDMSINGFMMSPLFSTKVYDGKNV